MNISVLPALGLCSALFCLLGFAFYARNIIKRKTKPERSSWWIWTILMAVALAAQAAAGSTWSLLLTTALLLGNICTAILSVRYGYGRFKVRDYAALLVTFAGLYLWKVTNSPLAALLVIITIDFMGNMLTIVKTWRAPYSENSIAWTLNTIGAVFGIFAVGSSNITRLIFPVYVVIPNIMTIWVISHRRKWRSSRIILGRHRSSRMTLKF